MRIDRLVNGENLFYTAAAEHIYPYALRTDLWHVALPTASAPGKSDFGPVDEAALRAAGRLETAGWLGEVEAHWREARKDGEATPLHERLDQYGHLRGQAHMKRYVVLYNASGGRPAAAVLDTSKLNRPFVARDKTYWFSTTSTDEAHFLAAFINSTFSFGLIVDFMTTGLFGPRDIHKRILDVPLPRFDKSNADHQSLAAASRKLSVSAAKALASMMAAGEPPTRREVAAKLDGAALEKVEKLVNAIVKTV